ncbi:hypothetical protein FGG08_006564 [Glutinoglossum americanum]|uniref:Uncharacterized protein n=1 Tax=Glutinoglossum americanum TaxID=1670608 RepID=A0A9P8HY25_9PEZI|nr:hypothetical protein FGG08_006564 [Glutinoglossum americanum]
MPAFFSFQQGTESRVRQDQESPLLGRFRALPAGDRRSRRRSVGDLFAGFRRHSVNYGTLGDGTGDGDIQEEGMQWSGVSKVKYLFVEPREDAVKAVVERWWSRWMLLILLPAGIAIGWCAIPFPSYPLSDSPGLLAIRDNIRRTHPIEHPKSTALGAFRFLQLLCKAIDPRTFWQILYRDHVGQILGRTDISTNGGGDNAGPGHGEALVRLNFWFFLFIYYGIYNTVGLLWVTKLFNIYSMNWWPFALGLPSTVVIIIIWSLTIPIPIYLAPKSNPLTNHNTTWITLTFFTMLIPVLIAFGILLKSERHLGLRNQLSETQRLFTSNWWTSDGDTIRRRDRRRQLGAGLVNPDAPLEVQVEASVEHPRRRFRKRWIPASFVRFLWFCLALFIGLLCFVLGEAYAEVYLRTLPHNNIETIVYVYSWVATVYMLDGITGWILGGGEGERVGSYPLGWIFKLYFMLTYQTYVRALYARLRSPSQFAILQVLSSSFLIIITPISMTRFVHKLFVLVGLNGQEYAEYRKFVGRSFFLRGIAENVSMLAFLGEVVALHFGANKDIYPYFSFSDPNDPYTFELTFYASIVTWACEIVASWIVRRIMGLAFQFDVTAEGITDLTSWPELVPTSL